VDDDLSFLDSLKSFLTHKGHKVFTAHDAATARSVINNVHIDLVILDLRLSDDYDYNDQSGLNLAEEEAFRGIPIIVYTGYLASRTAVEALRSKTGASPLIVDIIEKGADTNRLLVTIERELKKRISISEPIQFYSCFISYSSRDEEFARRLYSRLRDEGIRVWYAPEDVRGGERLHEQIDRAIQIHDRVLLILSENSLRSEWVTTEIRRTRKLEIKENCRKLFPIRVVDYESIRKWECIDIETGKDLATEIREYFIPDFSDWKDHDSFEASFSRLLRDIKSSEVPITKLPLEEQEAWLLHTLETNPQQPSARFELAKIHQRQGKLDEAEADLLKLLEMDASSLDVRTELAKIYQRQNRLAEAEAVLLNSLEIDSQQLHPRTELAKIYQRQNKLIEAEAVLLEILELDADNLQVRTELAKIYQRQGKLDEAIQRLEEEIIIAPEALQPRTELAKIYQRQLRFHEAEDVLLESLKIDPRHLQVRTELAKIYYRQNKFADAETLLLTSLEIDQNQLHPRIELARIYKQQGRLNEAEKVAEEVLAIDPLNDFAISELLAIWQRQGEKEKCAQRFLEFIVQPSYRFTRYSQASVFRFFRCCKAFNMKEYATQVFERFQSELDDQNLKYYMSAFSNK
jgi:tetratricopeptide (TPR) repeat protein/ActR/RegA family two-component response regulator